MITSGFESTFLQLLLDPYSDIISCCTKLSMPGIIDWHTTLKPIYLIMHVANMYRPGMSAFSTLWIPFKSALAV